MKKAIVIAAAILATGCSDQKVSWETQEMQRSVAIENSEFNARAFRQKNTHFSNLSISPRGDSTIGPDCANGDGWASIDLVDKNGTVKERLKCSTASATLGCLLKADFQTKAYASEEGRCNTNLPVPMPKINK